MLLTSALLAWLAPGLADGYAALGWTRYHAAARPEGPPAAAERLRQLSRWTVRTIDTLAPLPQAGEAARLSLAAAGASEADAPLAAAALYANVASALERQSASPWRRLGLGAVAAEARQREAGLRAHAGGSGPTTTR